MSRRDTGISAEPAARDWYADRLRTHWPAVRVAFAETVPCTAGRRVRAVVHLGDLTPADVKVAVSPAPTLDTLSCSDERIMSSAESYDNGSFVFERTILAAELPLADDWLVCVRPVEEVGAHAVVYRLAVVRRESPSSGAPDVTAAG